MREAWTWRRFHLY